ncbi:hypothetical protein F5Y19DRAFT_469299 [Xylariaceae sp. FL1651]|nr:hypothetical protein F5Y19DRAFT_469299 [Xylariaceae sp. FL1651]
MSGIEVAGLVLGGFPILLNCLDYYREGFEPLEEWWNFRTHFIAFVDDVRHQMMRYNENMIRLLDPVITDTGSLAKLVEDPTDHRWKDHSLDDLLKRHLASELDRFLRIINRMYDVVRDLNKLLQIQDGQVSWVGSSQQKPWQWHFKRVQISFSKGKHKKIKKLATHNDELQEILGYNERIIPISDRRKSSDPVRLFENIRQHAYCVYNALKQQWKCQKRCQTHGAHMSVRAETVSVSLNIMFIVQSGHGTPPTSKTQEVLIRPKEAPLYPKRQDISYVQQAVPFAELQQRVIQEDAELRSRPKLIGRFSQRLYKKRSSLKGSSAKEPQSTVSTAKGVTFGLSIPSTIVTPPEIELTVKTEANDSSKIISGSSAPISGQTTGHIIPANNSASSPITDLCSFLASKQPESGVIRGDSHRHLELSKSSKGLCVTVSNSVRLFQLPQLLEATHQATIEIPRRNRFEMATHIASALLQTHLSPWLPAKWSKRDFYFLADMESQSLCSSHPFVSRYFLSSSEDEDGSVMEETTSVTHPQISEEETRACLFTVGVIILELIFGHNIEDCNFRKNYYGKDNKPNDQTDVSTARTWAKKVLGDSGADVADVVRRCLDCSFGPKPSFLDVRFRESVYEGVIKPLASYLDVWSEVKP